MNGNMLTPNHLRFALAFATSGNAVSLEGYDSEHGREVRGWLCREGLVDWDQEGDPATPRLRAWIDHLCSQPLPECTWVVPQPPVQP